MPGVACVLSCFIQMSLYY